MRARTLARVLDVGFLAILIAWAQADVWAPQITTPNHMVGDSRVLSVAALAAGLALLARHRWPLASAASVFGLLGIPAVLYGTSEGLGWFLLAGLALYSLGAHAALRPALLGLALYAAWSTLLVTRDPLRHDLESTVRAFLYSACLIPAWVIGVVVRNPRLRAIEWERRATRLERERHQAERDAVTRERSLISRELHDIVAHSVSMIVLQAEAGDSRLDSDPGAARRAFHAIEESARQSMGELRRLLGLLRVDDSMGDSLPQPRLSGVPALLESIRRAGLRSTLEVSGDPVELAPGLELNAYRIIQEALTNSLKHARASEVRVHVSFTPGVLELEITDDGLVPALPNGSGGHGLVGMRERALLYGGELEVSQRDSQGYRVWVRLPVESAR